MKLTAKQEQFAQLIAQGKTQADAYREAYSAGKMTDKQIYSEACELAKNPKVAGRIVELRAPAVEKCQITVELLTEQLLETRTIALASNQSSAAVAATMGIAKLHGLEVEQRRNDRNPFADWDAPEMQQALEQVNAAVAKAKRAAPTE